MCFSFAISGRFWHGCRVRGSGSSNRTRKLAPRLSGGALIGSLCFVCLACAIVDDGDTNFRDDVLLCEEAVTHLQDCCPNLGEVYAEACEFRRDGCNNGRNVSLDLRTSRCIRDKECAELVQQGICDRASEVVASGYADNGFVDGGARGGEVCP